MRTATPLSRPMRAVLLAAGLGTRLAAVSGGRPKILVEVGGRPLLDHQLHYLAAGGVTEVVVNLHHRAELVRSFLAGRTWPVRVHTSYEPELLGTAGALVPVRDLLDASFVVLYGDVVTDVPLPAVVERHLAAGAAATVCCHRPETVTGKGIVTLDGDDRVTGFAEKPPRAAPGGWVNAGLYVLEPAVVAAVPAGPADFGYDVFPGLLASGALVKGYRHGGVVLDVGTPAGLRRAQDLVRGGRPG
jgi:NDP-sugar pyrophosphorylase family protein